MSYGPPRGTQVNSRLRVGVSPAAQQINRNLPFAQTETRGPGFLAGEPPPGGTVTGDGIPISATVRLLLRTDEGDPADGMLVASTISAPNGSWFIGNLNPDLRYDAVGRKAGYADVIVSNLRPMRSDLMELVKNVIEENDTHSGLDGYIEFVGGLPPYSHAIVGTIPPGLTAVFDRRRLSFSGTATEFGTWNFDVVFTSSNGLSLTVTVTVEFVDLLVQANRWRIYITAHNGRASAQEIEFFARHNYTSKVSTGGTATASSVESAAYPVEQAFDGNRAGSVDQCWASGTGVPQWVAYAFPAPVAITGFDWWARTWGGGAGQTPRDFTLQYSKDGGTTWVNYKQWTGRVGSTWTAGQKREFRITD